MHQSTPDIVVHDKSPMSNKLAVSIYTESLFTRAASSASYGFRLV